MRHNKENNRMESIRQPELLKHPNKKAVPPSPNKLGLLCYDLKLNRSQYYIDFELPPYYYDNSGI
jgi:hypothetical protein